jgi:hypothetical protein
MGFVQVITAHTLVVDLWMEEEEREEGGKNKASTIPRIEDDSSSRKPAAQGSSDLSDLRCVKPDV